VGIAGHDLFFSAVERTRMPTIVTDPRRPDNPIVLANAAFLELTGYDLDEILGRNCRFLQGPATSRTSVARVRAAVQQGREISLELLNYRKDGSSFWNELHVSPVLDRSGTLLYFFASQLDVTRRRIAEGALGPAVDERRAAEAALQESEAKFRAIAESMPQLVWSTDAAGEPDYFNRRWCDHTGMAGGRGAEEVLHDFLHPDDRERATAAWRRCLVSGENHEIEYRVREAATGRYRWFLGRATPLRDPSGRIVRWFGTCTDIHDAVAARQTLARGRVELERLVAERTEELTAANERLRAEIAERERAEAALRQAQKMEAVGQLTGGIAHDFNNLLTVIVGNLETARRHLDGAGGPLPEPARRGLDNARRGAERAATLTQRLLAFARRQPLSPEPVAINRLVAGMSDLLRRALGETVRLETELAPGLWSVEVDPNQLEAALLNLAVNARDAMPDGGGRLTIETGNVRLDERYAAANAEVAAGEYVVLCVSDTGGGIPKELLGRVFEPFFTTKEVGQGTGLGLSQVYGFVRQSGGHVKIYSEPGEGTTVRIYLPRLAREPGAGEREAEAPVAKGQREEIILVVEDDTDVRAHSVGILRELGYGVLEAEGGAMALRLLERHPNVRLLFTDVVLPGMNGRELADAARRRHPRLKVLFTTGYARSAIVHDGRLEPGVEVLSKPFTYEALAAKVREALGSTAAASRVLVVEDEAMVRMMVGQALRDHGYEPEEAATAAEAVELVRAAKRPFDAVIVDLGLPDRRGDALMDELRELVPDLPILIASGYGAAELEQRVRGKPRLATLAKPYDVASLHAALRALLAEPPRSA
jgi:PAS domain S-box-containing protein